MEKHGGLLVSVGRQGEFSYMTGETRKRRKLGIVEIVQIAGFSGAVVIEAGIPLSILLMSEERDRRKANVHGSDTHKRPNK